MYYYGKTQEKLLIFATYWAVAVLIQNYPEMFLQTLSFCLVYALIDVAALKT